MSIHSCSSATKPHGRRTFHILVSQRQGSQSSLGNTKASRPCISQGAAASNPVYTVPLQEGIVTLKNSKRLKGFSFRLSCREVSSRAPDLLFHRKIRERKFVGDQTNRNTLEETVGEAGEIVGLNKAVSESSPTMQVVFPHSSHPADPQTLPRQQQPGCWGEE